MTNTEFKELRLSLGLSIALLAHHLNTPYHTVKSWESGDRRIPGIVEVAMRTVAREHPNRYPDAVFIDIDDGDVELPPEFIEPGVLHESAKRVVPRKR
jgi:DNA-binding XRE family transcriptional regulator